MCVSGTGGRGISGQLNCYRYKGDRVFGATTLVIPHVAADVAGSFDRGSFWYFLQNWFCSSDTLKNKTVRPPRRSRPAALDWETGRVERQSGGGGQRK